jgi:hypothetical protein
MVLHLIKGNLKSDCYYNDLSVDSEMSGRMSLAAKEKVTIKLFEPDYTFVKSKYDYTDEELLKNKEVDFLRNETTCNKRVITIDGNIYYCPGFIELNEPIMHISEYTKEGFENKLYEMYLKPLVMCTSKDLNDIKRFCPVKSRCDRNMCYCLNKKITGDSRFPFSNFCKIKESRYTIKIDTEKEDILMILLNSLAKINEAILSISTANPSPVIKNRLKQIVDEVNSNIETILKKIEGE